MLGPGLLVVRRKASPLPRPLFGTSDPSLVLPSGMVCIPFRPGIPGFVEFAPAVVGRPFRTSATPFRPQLLDRDPFNSLDKTAGPAAFNCKD